MEYRSVIPTPKKVKKVSSFHTTTIVPPDQDFRPGDFVMLREDKANDQAPIWRFDSKTLLQRFNVAGRDDTNEVLYKSANLFSGYIAANRQRYVSVAVKFISSEGSNSTVKVIQSASTESQGSADPEIRKRSYGETGQFQENFEVYIQALISQCLDGNFLDEVFSDQGKACLMNSNLNSAFMIVLIENYKMVLL